MRRTSRGRVTDTDETPPVGPTEVPSAGSSPRSLACASWRMQMTRHPNDAASITALPCAGRARKDGHWLCTPVDPGSSPGTGPKIVKLSRESARLKHARRWTETTHDHKEGNGPESAGDDAALIQRKASFDTGRADGHP